MLTDKTDATSTNSGSHLSHSFVFEPDRNNGSYEIPSKPPGPDNAQVDETLIINPRLGVISRDVDDEVTMILNWQPGFTSIPRTMGMFSMTCTIFKRQETVTTPGLDTETGYGHSSMPDQHPELDYYEMPTSLIIDLVDATKDVDGNGETIRQALDLSTYRSQSDNKAIETYSSLLHVLHGRIGSRLLTLIKDRIKTYHGEKHERFQGHELYSDISWGAFPDTTSARKDTTNNVQGQHTWKVSDDEIRDLVEIYQTNPELPNTILLRYLGSDKISILRYLKDEEDTMYRCKLSSMDKLENTGKHE